LAILDPVAMQIQGVTDSLFQDGLKRAEHRWDVLSHRRGEGGAITWRRPVKNNETIAWVGWQDFFGSTDFCRLLA
jgi:hypothetical protein